MKKLILGLLPVLTFALAACGGDDKKDDSSVPDPSSPADPGTDPGTDPGEGPEGDPSGWYVVGAGSFVTAEWSTEGGRSLITNPTSVDPNAVTEQWTYITFEADDLWKITNGTVWIQMNCVEDGTGSAKTAGDMVEEEDSDHNKNMKVVTPGTYDIYFKTYASANPEGTDGYSVWVQAHTEA